MLLSGWCMKGTQQHRYNRGWGTPVTCCFLPRPLSTSLILSFPPNWHLYLFSVFFFTFSFHLLFSPSFPSPAPCPPLFSLHLYYNNSPEDPWLLISWSSRMNHLCTDLNMCGYTVGAAILLQRMDPLQYTSNASWWSAGRPVTYMHLQE